MFLAMMLFNAVVGRAAEAPLTSVGVTILGGVGMIFAAGIIPGIAVAVRRMHDQDKSGWFILLGLIPYVGGLVLLIMAFMSGTDGENHYGPDPRDPMQGTADVFL